MFLTKLAVKNLIRHRNRTVITAFIIATAIFIYIMFDSLILGMTQISYNNIIDYEAGHLQVVNNKYWQEKDDLPLDNLINVNKRIIDKIKNVENYKADSPELNFQARLNNGTNELPVMGKGIIPERFANVFALENKFVEGSMFTSGENKAVLGKRLADLMKLRLGDYITLLVKDKNDIFNTIEAEISGLIHTVNPNVNRNIVYLPLDKVQQALNVGNNVSKVIVRLENKDQASDLAGKLEDNLSQTGDKLAVYSWNELEAVTIAGAKQMGNKFILMIILIIAAIAIINTVILAALERIKEIGMMKAMGLEVKEIIYTFVIESTGIGILGGIIGTILGAIGVWFLSTYGIDFAGLVGMDMSIFGVPVLGKFYGHWNPEAIISVFFFGIIVSFVASILPAYWAASKDPVNAIYHR